MRSLPLSQYSSSAAKWARLAAAAGAAAGLAVLGACTDSKPITAPPSPRNSTIQSGGLGNAGVVSVCVDASSPAGTYKFTNSGFLGYFAVGVGGALDGANGGNGSTSLTVPVGTEYAVAPGTCTPVMTRVSPDSFYPGTPDTWSGVTMTATTIPPGVVYDKTDCLLDQGVKVAIPDPCDTGNNPTRAYMNIQHGTQVTFFFSGAPTSCPDGVISAKFNGELIPTGRTIWFVANLKPDGPIVNGTEITFTNSVITVNGVNIGALPNGLVRYVAGLPQATTNFSGGQWVTQVPLSWGKKDVFLAGAMYVSPGLGKGAIAEWSGAFASNTNGVKAKWQFSAAVYSTFGAYGALGVKPIDSNSLTLYNNSDHVGTPENFKNFIVAGAMGGGGSNFTGSWSSTKAVCVE